MNFQSSSLTKKNFCLATQVCKAFGLQAGQILSFSLLDTAVYARDPYSGIVKAGKQIGSLCHLTQVSKVPSANNQVPEQEGSALHLLILHK